MIDALVEFLRARLDEDVEHAEGVRGGDWEDRSAWEDLAPEVIYHARWHDPDRVLREVEAKRKVVDAYAEALRILEGFREVGHETGNREALELACKAFAAAYATDPQFRAEWRV